MLLTPRRTEQREQILDAAYDLVADVGIEGLRTREICKRADLNLAIFHYCFGSKDDFLRALYQYIVTQFRQESERFINEGQGPTEKLEGYLRLRVFLTQHMTRELKVWRCFLGLAETNGAVREILSEHFAAQRERISHVLKVGIERGEFQRIPTVDPEVTAALIVSLQMGMILQLGIDPMAFDPEQYVSPILDWVRGDG